MASATATATGTARGPGYFQCAGDHRRARGAAAAGHPRRPGENAKPAAPTPRLPRPQPAGPPPAAGTAADGNERLDRGSAAPPTGRRRRLQIRLVPHELPRTQISEAYRSLRTAMLLSSARELKVVAVTSATAGEGKTATAANLAIVLAQLGRPVLIVDADLRKPRLHQVFRLSNQIGLVSLPDRGHGRRRNRPALPPFRTCG